MSLHVFGAIITHHGTAANNRGETDGNITTLQKILWKGQVHTTVSAEAVRFALRRRLEEAEETNRVWDEETRANTWQDPDFKQWKKKDADVYIDDDLLGFMSAPAAKEEGKAGKADVRRAVLEVSRAISLTPWSGDVTFNAASVGATPSAAKKGANPVPYGTEVHATRYQYGFAMTPERLREPGRAKTAVEGLVNLGHVAGNHGRFLFDFSPEAIVLRLTPDPAPRLLYCFETDAAGQVFDAPALVKRAKAGDIDPGEVIVGGTFPAAEELKGLGAEVLDGVKAACGSAVERLDKALKKEGASS